MTFPRLVLQKLKGSFLAARGSDRRFHRPLLEPLEDRWVPSLTNPNNNAVIPKVQLQAIYYNDLAGQPALPKAQLDNFLTYLVGSPYITTLNQYATPTQSITTGSSLPGYNTNITISSNINFNSNNGVAPTTNYTGLGVYDSQIRMAINSALDNASPPIANDGINKLFLVYLPAGVGESYSQGNSTTNSIDAYGYHFNYMHDGKSVRYAVIFYPGSGGGTLYSPLTAFEQLTEITSHEVAESITNPDGVSWADPHLGASGEVGDLENLNYSTLNGYVVQDLWSNTTSGPIRAAGTSLFIDSFSNPTEGPFNGPIATFTDLDAAGGVTYTALVNWGDGSPSVNATVTPAGGGTFSVTGQHTFTGDDGTQLNPQVWITSTSGAQAHAVGQLNLSDGITTFHFNDLGLVTLQDAPLTPIPVTVNVEQGSSLNTQLVGQFSDPGTDGTNADYTATVTWIDGNGNTHSSAGTVSATPTGNVFSVFGNDTTLFTAQGSYKVSVLVADHGGKSTTILSSAVVGPPSVSATGNFKFTDIENFPSGAETVATFTDPAGPGPIGAYSADISWGDGSESTRGSISFDGTSTYTVVAGHKYTAPGSYTITVTIHRQNGPDATTTSTATVASDLNFSSPLNTTGGSISVNGTGLTEGEAITVTASDGINSASANSSVSGGLWSVSLDTSKLKNGWIFFSVSETNSSGGGITVEDEGIKGPALGFSGTPNITDANATNISVSGSGAFDGDTIDVSINDGTNYTNEVQTTVSGGSWSVSGIDASGLNDGQITYSLVESDSSGNLATDYQNATKKTGTLGFSSTPNINIANQKSVSVSGTGSNGDSISVTITDGTNTTTAATTVVSNKTWSVSAINAAGLTDGAVTYSVTETDSVGNSTTLTQTATKLTVPPAVAFTSAPDINIASAGNVAVSGTGDNGDTISLTITDGTHTTSAATTTVSGGTWSVNGINATSLADGTVTYTVTETDAVGNSTTIIESATKITVVPKVAFNAQDINLANVGDISVSGMGDDGDTIAVTITDGSNNTTPPATTIVSGGAWSAPPIDASSLVDGTVTYTVTETDAVGNTTTLTQTATKQVVPPAFTFNSAPNINLANYQNVTVSGTGDNGNLVTVTISDSTNTTTAAIAQVSDGTWSVSGIDASGLADGMVTYTAVETDGLGNTTTITQNVIKNTVAPRLAFTRAPPINIANQNSVLVAGTGDTGDVVSVTITDGSNTTTAATATVSAGTWSVTINPTALKDGSVTYTATTTVVGNTTTITRNATKITVAAAVAFTSAPNIATANQHSVFVIGTGDNGDTIAVTITDGVHTTTAATTAVSGGTWSTANIDASGIADGTVSYAVTETDPAGNTTTVKQSATKATVAPGTPVVTPSLANLVANATTFTIQGSSFSTTAANNIVKFSGGATGKVTHATATTLTVTGLTGLTAGSLSVTVTVGKLTSVSEPVATVVPVVTANKATLAVKATTVVIHGFGYSTTAANNKVKFSNGATGKVTHATATTLTVTSLSGAPAGNLDAIVTSNGVSSTAYVQVAIVPITAPKVTASRQFSHADHAILERGAWGHVLHGAATQEQRQVGRARYARRQHDQPGDHRRDGQHQHLPRGRGRCVRHGVQHTREGDQLHAGTDCQLLRHCGHGDPAELERASGHHRVSGRGAAGEREVPGAVQGPAQYDHGNLHRAVRRDQRVQGSICRGPGDPDVYLQHHECECDQPDLERGRRGHQL